MKYFKLFLFLSLSSLTLKAGPGDTTLPWDYSTTLQLNFQQLQLKNWQGGGQNTLGLNGYFEQNVNYIKGRNLWTNRLNMAYGQVRLGGNMQPFIKSDDELRFSTKYTYTFKPTWSAVALADFRTFIAPGYQYEKDSNGVDTRGALLSKFFSPAYIVDGIGIEYKPTDVFYVSLLPISTKTTIVLNDSLAAAGTYGDMHGGNSRIEFGAVLKSLLKWEFIKNVELQNELNLFGDYKKLNTIDVLENLDLLIKANKYVTAKFGVNLIYDEDIKVTKEDGTEGPATQVKEALSIGLIYTY
jgi:hypothetical protein